MVLAPSHNSKQTIRLYSTLIQILTRFGGFFYGVNMIYTTGTIAGNGSTITGTGTNFTAAGSLIRVGCTLIAFTNPVQVLQITAITSGNALSVTPAVSPAIAAGTKFAILLSDSLSVDGLAQDIAETFGMYQKYMSGFADVMNGTGNVTITINGVNVTIPGQKSLAKKGANSDITSLSGLTTALSVGQGGTGGKTAAEARVNIGAAASDDGRFDTIDGNSGGHVKGNIYAENRPGATTEGNTTSILAGKLLWANGTEAAIAALFASMDSTGNVIGQLQFAKSGVGKNWTFNPVNGNAVAPGAWMPNSDGRLKDKVERIEDPLDKMKRLKGCTWMRLDSGEWGIGFIAQDVASVFPKAVHAGEDRELSDGSTVEKVLSPDTYGVAAALHHEAILALMSEIEELKAEMKEMKGTQENLHNA